MMKNLIIIIFICTLVYSCGKKGDPVYNNEKFNHNNIYLHLDLLMWKKGGPCL